MTLQRLPMESDRFGLEVYRCTASGRELVSLRREAEEQGADLVIVRCEAEDWAGIHAVEEAGGRLMDTHLTYERQTQDVQSPVSPAYHVRPGRPEDASVIAELARSAFKDYGGHFHADRRLAPHATAVYVDWAQRSVLDRTVADAVLVAEADDGGLVGFSTLVIRSGTGIGVLDAVSPSAQGRGIYALLGASRIALAAERGAGQLLVRTHLVNVGARRGLGRLGFLPSAQEHTFHLWVRPAP